jgi:class 3 adenylate cyclase
LSADLAFLSDCQAVVGRPKTQYAIAGDGAHIAFQVLGDGPFDLVVIPGWISNLELFWEDPVNSAFYERLASFSRVILLDKRGTGLSDPVAPGSAPTLEQRMDDLRAVLDTVGSETAAFFTGSEGGPMSLLFAATYPERTRALVLYGSWARAIRGPDYPYGYTRAEFEELVALVEQHWGQARLLDRIAPTLAEVPEAIEAMSRYERLSATPATAGALLRMAFEGDIRSVLPVVNVPTLVMHRTSDQFVAFEHGRYLAEHIPGAKLIELAGEDHAHWDLTDRIAEETETFLTGERPVLRANRQLATVLFTDVVESTRHAAELGDQQWAQLLDQLDDIVGRQIARYRGHLVKGTGDGHLATFDGPGRAIACAQALHEGVARLGVTLRVGLHTGEIEVRGQDVGGIAVHVAARVIANASSGETLVSASVPPLVLGSGIEFTDRGEHDLKGVPGVWRLFAVQVP